MLDRSYFISPRTVKRHTISIYGKLQVNSRRTAVEWSIFAPPWTFDASLQHAILCSERHCGMRTLSNCLRALDG
jgi:hypothetical protein